MPKRPVQLEQFDLMPCIDRAIDALVLGSADVDVGMQALIAMASAVHSSPAWARLAKLRWRDDPSKARAWLTRELRPRAIPSSAKGLWFGAPALYMNPPVLELCAYKTFTLDDVDCRWAKGRVYPVATTARRSSQGEFSSASMAKAALALGVPSDQSPDDRVRQMDDLMDSHFLAFFVVSLGYSCLLVAQLCRELDPDLLRGSSRQRGVTVGFSEGGHHQIGTVDKSGWHPRPLCWIPSPDEDDEH